MCAAEAVRMECGNKDEAGAWGAGQRSPVWRRSRAPAFVGSRRCRPGSARVRIRALGAPKWSLA
eukprot:4858572-Alexandrium_andersonii.AAC.1